MDDRQEGKIGLAADHAGYELKEAVKQFLIDKGVEVVDYGTHSSSSCDYPDYAHALGRALEGGQVQRGISVCGSGVGISMALNKHKGVRAALAWDEKIAVLARQHNDANVLSLPGRFVSEEKALEMVSLFLNTPFEGGRHVARVEKISKLD